MHVHMIKTYCYFRHYFYVCAWQVLSFILLLIFSTIVGNIKARAVIFFRNSEVRVVVCFKQIQIFYNLTHYIFSLHSYSYFISHMYYLHYRFYHIHNTIVTVMSQAYKDWLPQGVDDCSEVGNSTFVSHYFCNQ